MTANRLTSFLLMVIVFSPITDIFSDALWDDNITDAQHVLTEILYFSFPLGDNNRKNDFWPFQVNL